MIKIINGTFGYNDGKRVIPKTPKDKPFECNAKTEKRLVSLGVAIYVNKVETDVEEEPAEEVTLSKDELVAKYKSLGLGGNPSVMKEETLIKKIKEAEEALEEVANEVAPSFDEVDGVEN